MLRALRRVRFTTAGDGRATALKALADAAVADGVLHLQTGFTGEIVLQACLLQPHPVLLNCHCVLPIVTRRKQSLDPSCVCSGLPGQTAAPTVDASAAAAALAIVLIPSLSCRKLAFAHLASLHLSALGCLRGGRPQQHELFV